MLSPAGRRFRPVPGRGTGPGTGPDRAVLPVQRHRRPDSSTCFDIIARVHRRISCSRAANRPRPAPHGVRGPLVPGFMGKEASADEESFASGLLEYPHYTRPEVFEGLPVPPDLLTGHHAAIDRPGAGAPGPGNHPGPPARPVRQHDPDRGRRVLFTRQPRSRPLAAICISGSCTARCCSRTAKWATVSFDQTSTSTI
jgi:hypothetical protein